ncbi:MAG: hypothetical protein OXF79_12800 [Chloroflexi bacterium]|nr:hypothetical protein [Chloroflexota bacterium]
MSKSYLPYDPDQRLLLRQALQEWLPEDHLAGGDSLPAVAGRLATHE